MASGQTLNERRLGTQRTPTLTPAMSKRSRQKAHARKLGDASSAAPAAPAEPPAKTALSKAARRNAQKKRAIKQRKAAADEKGVDLDYDAARELVYGMPYAEWKDKHQTEATPEQLAKMKEKAGH